MHGAESWDPTLGDFAQHLFILEVPAKVEGHIVFVAQIARAYTMLGATMLPGKPHHASHISIRLLRQVVGCIPHT